MALSRLMRNFSGLCQRKRRLLGTVVESEELYATPVWSTSVSAIAKSTTNLRRLQRQAVLRAIRAYRTVSDEATFQLVDRAPVDLVAEEKRRIIFLYWFPKVTNWL